jgi:hypothetical protein
MKRFILTTAAVAFALVLGSTTNLNASPPHGHGGGHGHATVHAHVVVHSHHPLVVHGHSVNVRYYNRGYHGWSARCWFPSYRTYGYYSGGEWFYWYAPLNEYLPTTYMSIYPPTVAVAPVAVIPTTSLPVVALPALPPGATIVPGPIPSPY